MSGHWNVIAKGELMEMVVNAVTSMGTVVKHLVVALELVLMDRPGVRKTMRNLALSGQFCICHCV